MIVIPNGTVVRHHDGKLIHYSVEIDLEALQLLAIKASQNKGQRSVDGPVTVTILNDGKAEFLKAGA